MKLLKLMGVPLVVVATVHALTLEDAVARAQRNNPIFHVLLAEVAIAEGAKTGAGVRVNPELTIGPGIVRSTGDGAAGYRFRGELGVSQTFEFPGKRSLRIHLADGEVRLRELALDGFRQQLAIQVRRSFIEALVARQVWALRAEQLGTAETFLKSAKNRVAGGYASAFELVQAQADRIAAARGVSQAQGRMRSAKLKLAQRMGSPADTSIEVRGNLDSVLAATEIVNPLDLALAKNPALAAMALRVELSDKAVQAAHLASKPDLTVNPALEYSRDEQAFGVGFSVPLPVWNRGGAEIATATAEKRRALGELENLRQELTASIGVAQEHVVDARAQLDLYAPEFLAEVKNIMLRAEKVYDQNATSLLMYLEARRSYYASLSDYYETIGQLAEAQSELATAIGVARTETSEPVVLEKP
jgi:cobalt-zinc-cadmium efflux system outer membrane protein